MSRSLLHDWEYKIDKCCKENLPVEMKRIAEDIYNTAYARGKNRADDVLDEVKAEILDEAEYAYADFDRYKEDILHAEPDELPDDDFRYGMERAVQIINKYVKESVYTVESEEQK